MLITTTPKGTVLKKNKNKSSVTTALHAVFRALLPKLYDSISLICPFTSLRLQSAIGPLAPLISKATMSTNTSKDTYSPR